MDSLNLKQKITLVAFEVDYYDRREVKHRTLHHERVVLNGGRLNALDRLGIRPASWIVQQFETQGFAVQQVKKGQSMDAQVDLTALWSKTAAEKAEEDRKLAAEKAERERKAASAGEGSTHEKLSGGPRLGSSGVHPQGQQF